MPELKDCAIQNLELFSIADNRVQISVTDGFVKCDGAVLLGVTPKEREVVAVLASTPDTIITPEELTYEVYGYADKSAVQSMRVHLSNTRASLGPELGNPKTGAFRTAKRSGYYAVSSLDYNIHDFDSEDPSVIRLADSRLEVKVDESKVKIDGRAVENITGARLAILVYLAKEHDKYVTGEELKKVAQNQAGIDCPNMTALGMQITQLRRILGPDLGHNRQGVIRNKRFVGYTALSTLES